MLGDIMKILVDCVNCGLEFDILIAKPCECVEYGSFVCSYCGKCACDADLSGWEAVTLSKPISGIKEIFVKRI